MAGAHDGRARVVFSLDVVVAAAACVLGRDDRRSSRPLAWSVRSDP